MLPIFVIVPLGCAFLIPLVVKLNQRLPRIFATFGSGLLLWFSIQSIFLLKGTPQVYYVGGWKPPFGICMVLDGLTVLLLLVVNIIGFISLLYSLDYMKRYTAGYLYYTLFSLLLAGLNGVVISGDLFNLFVFLAVFLA